MKDFKKYLPSQNFYVVVLILVIILSLFFIVKKTIFIISKHKSGEKVVAVSELIEKDSNKNSIPDWEEYLWGLDPNKNGKENKDFIETQKQKISNNDTQGIYNAMGNSADNDILSKQFFAAVISLQQNGQLTEETVSSLTDAISSEVETIDLPDSYGEQNLKKVPDSDQANVDYFSDFVSLIAKYKDSDMGLELKLLSQGLANKDPQILYAAKTIADSYRSFGFDLSTKSVPYSIASVHLSLINNYEKVAICIEQSARMLEDPIVGMKALVSYKKYISLLNDDINRITEILK